MNLEEKFLIKNDFLDRKVDLVYLDNLNHNKNDEITKLREKAHSSELEKEANYLSKVEHEYIFFNHLHIQGKYDNIISLIKIADRLDIDLNFRINIESPNYDLMWEKINEQILVPTKLIEFIEEYELIINGL